MKRSKISCWFVMAALLSMLNCGRSLPEAYGIYIDTNHGRVQLRGHGVQLAGNMMSYFSGLTGPSGAECDSLKEIVVYQKNIEPGSVHLAKLQFLKTGRVSQIFGTSLITVNLWVPNQDQVELDIRPVEQRRDMYILKPRQGLENGFYAISVGRFGGEMGSPGQVYDFVVGSAKDFPSYVAALTNRKDEAKKSAPALLDKLNRMLNRAEYEHLGDVYRPGGRALSGDALDNFVKGNQTWLSTSGKVVKSEVIAVVPIDENNARCTVRTTYEKTGAQQESVTIGKIEGRYFVTDMK